MKTIIIGIATASLALTGCTGLTGLAKQLKNDPAVVQLDVVTLYGTGRFVRVGNNTNNVTISPDGTVNINPQRSNAPPMTVQIVNTNVIQIPNTPTKLTAAPKIQPARTNISKARSATNSPTAHRAKQTVHSTE